MPNQTPPPPYCFFKKRTTHASFRPSNGDDARLQTGRKIDFFLADRGGGGEKNKASGRPDFEGVHRISPEDRETKFAIESARFHLEVLLTYTGRKFFYDGAIARRTELLNNLLEILVRV